MACACALNSHMCLMLLLLLTRTYTQAAGGYLLFQDFTNPYTFEAMCLRPDWPESSGKRTAGGISYHMAIAV